MSESLRGSAQGNALISPNAYSGSCLETCAARKSEESTLDETGIPTNRGQRRVTFAGLSFLVEHSKPVLIVKCSQNACVHVSSPGPYLGRYKLTRERICLCRKIEGPDV